jgi:hypothetical protein
LGCLFNEMKGLIATWISPPPKCLVNLVALILSLPLASLLSFPI